jgi:hypothetical protein
MLRKTAVPALLLAAAAIATGQQVGGTNTDPRSSDANGNGPPAVTIEDKSKSDKSDKTDKPDKKAASERPLSGFVTDADGKPIVGAVVQLKNTRTLQIRSYITREKGDYYFAGLSKDVDYEVKAQINGHTSALRTLSSFDPKAQPVINLQVK